ncbi:MAG: hypothetical protein ACUVSV_16010, partial [Armatimonadota bacterium]
KAQNPRCSQCPLREGCAYYQSTASETHHPDATESR